VESYQLLMIIWKSRKCGN